MNRHVVKTAVAVMACGLAAGCTVAGAPAAAEHPATAGSPAGAPFVYVTGKGGTNEISQFASLGSGRAAAAHAPERGQRGVPLRHRGQPAGHQRLREGEGALSQFAISPVTGKITPLSPATVTASSHGSLGVALTP